jgi:hypothetical protein
MTTRTRISSHHCRDLSRISTEWSEHATKSWANLVINADDISQDLASLGDKVKALIDVFMVIPQRRHSFARSRAIGSSRVHFP